MPSNRAGARTATPDKAARVTLVSAYPQAIWSNQNKLVINKRVQSTKFYDGAFRIECGKHDELDLFLIEHDWPTVDLDHGNGARVGRHWTMDQSDEFIVVADQIQSYKEMKDNPDVRYGIAYGFSNKTYGDPPKMVGSKWKAVAFYVPWLELGWNKPILLTASGKHTFNVWEDKDDMVKDARSGKMKPAAHFSGAIVAMQDHTRLLDEINKVWQEQFETDQYPPVYAAICKLGGGDAEPFGSNATSLATPIISKLPAELTPEDVENLMTERRFPKFFPLIEKASATTACFADRVTQWSIEESAFLNEGTEVQDQSYSQI